MMDGAHKRSETLPLFFIEGFVLVAVSLIVVLMAAIFVIKGQPMPWPADFNLLVVISVVLFLAGLTLRALKSYPRVALGLIAVSIYTMLIMSLTVLNAMLFPLVFPLIDPLLFRIDAMLGYNWGGFVAFLSGYPLVSRALRVVYASSMLQLLVVLLALSSKGMVAQTHKMIVTGLFAGTMTIGFWFFFPSFGPSAYVPLTPQIREAADLVASPEYGAFLNRIAVEGLVEFTGKDMNGMVAFPSFHLIMALIALWFSRGTALFWGLLVVNTAMIPATLSHGGHHLVDLFGGLAFFGVAAWLAHRIVAARGTEKRQA